eukprot:12307506-Prorocentrum_lima.AAC.1
MGGHGHNLSPSSCDHLSSGRVRDPPKKFVVKNPEEAMSTTDHRNLKTEEPPSQAYTMNHANTTWD